MSCVQLSPDSSLLLVVDVQEKFLAPIWEAERVLARCDFLCQVAKALSVPVLATEQYPERMGCTHSQLAGYVCDPKRKMMFSAIEAVQAQPRKQVVIVGIETHICVSLTTHGLLAAGYEVVVCPDAVSARTQDRHKLGMERIRDAGAAPAHTEAVAYEWCKTADNPAFRDMLNIVKASQF